MAQIIENEGGGKKGHGKRKAKKHGTHIDMTPMVDLACLLLTFFMLTTAFSKPKVMEIIMPEKPKVNVPPPPQSEIPKSRTLNIILSKGDVVFWYIGKPGEPLEGTTLQKTDFSKDGIRKVLLQKNKALFEQIETLNTKVIKGVEKIGMDTLQARLRKFKKDDKVGPIVLIKADDDIKYRNMVDIIDEMAITNIARYSLVDITPKEKELIKPAVLQK